MLPLSERLRAVCIGVSAASVALAPPALHAAVNLEFRPSTQTVNLGATVNVGIYAVSSTPANQSFSIANIILGWEPVRLALLGNDDSGAQPWFQSSFPANDPYGINESSPPADGDGLYVAIPFPGLPHTATPGGALLTTIQFEALSRTAGTPVRFIPSAGTPVLHAAIYDPVTPNLNILGSLGSPATVVIVPEPAAGWLIAAAACLIVSKRRRA